MDYKEIINKLNENIPEKMTEDFVFFYQTSGYADAITLLDCNIGSEISLWCSEDDGCGYDYGNECGEDGDYDEDYFYEWLLLKANSIALGLEAFSKEMIDSYFDNE